MLIKQFGAGNQFQSISFTDIYPLDMFPNKLHSQLTWAIDFVE